MSGFRSFYKGNRDFSGGLNPTLPIEKIAIYVEQELKRILDGLDPKTVLQTIIDKTIDQST